MIPDAIEEVQALRHHVAVLEAKIARMDASLKDGPSHGPWRAGYETGVSSITHVIAQPVLDEIEHALYEIVRRHICAAFNEAVTPSPLP